MGYDGFTKTVNTSSNTDFLHNTFLMKNDTFSPFCMWRTAPNTRWIHLLFHIPKRIGNMFTTLFWQNIITHTLKHLASPPSAALEWCRSLGFCVLHLPVPCGLLRCARASKWYRIAICSSNWILSSLIETQYENFILYHKYSVCHTEKSHPCSERAE